MSAPFAFDLDRYVARIRAFDGARFGVAEAATVHHRDRAYPILAVRSKTVAPTRTLLVLAGVHGDEPAGLLAVPEIGLESSTRTRDEAARVRPHIDLVLALAQRL